MKIFFLVVVKAKHIVRQPAILVLRGGVRLCIQKVQQTEGEIFTNLKQTLPLHGCEERARRVPRGVEDFLVELCYIKEQMWLKQIK